MAIYLYRYTDTTSEILSRDFVVRLQFTARQIRRVQLHVLQMQHIA